MGEKSNHHNLKLSSQRDNIKKLISRLEQEPIQRHEKILTETFEPASHNLIPTSNEYYAVANYHLYHYILKHYKYKENKVCLWRYIKNLSDDQLAYKKIINPELQMMDDLVRIYFYSDPLDDLTCIFIPINDGTLIKKYLNWIKSYFYDANYPTSLLWLYALDSSLASLFPDEIIYLGKRTDIEDEDIMVPDFGNKDSILIKKFSNKPEQYVQLKGEDANNEFHQIFTFLQQEYKDRCLSRSGKQDEGIDKISYEKEWKKFETVLRFGVADDNESGGISFSDLRSSTEFLNTHGKDIYLNKIQHPFFEGTKLISKKFNGRIDKFMGDNVMCVFLNKNMCGETYEEKEGEVILNNFFALFDLCKMLYEIVVKNGFTKSKLGLRSGVTYGSQLLRSNLGNELLRDFTVTGETVNLAARLEHISIRELIIHNKMYFEKTTERFPQISNLISIHKNFENLNPETEAIVRDFTLYQNILSNLENLEKVKFDIRFNNRFYDELRQLLQKRGYEVQNPKTSEIYGYEEYNIEGFKFHFHFSYYNPKGFNEYKRIWILPLELETLENLDIETIK